MSSHSSILDLPLSLLVYLSPDCQLKNTRLFKRDWRLIEDKRVSYHPSAFCLKGCEWPGNERIPSLKTLVETDRECPRPNRMAQLWPMEVAGWKLEFLTAGVIPAPALGGWCSSPSPARKHLQVGTGSALLLLLRLTSDKWVRMTWRRRVLGQKVPAWATRPSQACSKPWEPWGSRRYPFSFLVMTPRNCQVLSSWHEGCGVELSPEWGTVWISGSLDGSLIALGGWGCSCEL